MRGLYQCFRAPGVSLRAGMEDAHFFYQRSNWCYQLAWQCFDLTMAHKLNVNGQ
jgi:hypothetical protein